MCTLTYLPLGNQEFLLTTNRDESPTRAHASFPEYLYFENKNIIFPKDPKAGGTWVATSDNGITVCLLNGADKPHEHKPPYRISRGIVLLEAIECIKPDEFFRNYDFKGIEPFTMVVLFHDPELKVVQFRWSGQETSIENLPHDEPHIWASHQLYTPDAIENRKKWFSNWLNDNKQFTTQNIIDFHKNAGSGDLSNDMVMDRGEVKTVSITSIASQIGSLSISYENLIDNTHQEVCLSQHVNQEFSNNVL
jgi:hypothetical protein